MPGEMSVIGGEDKQERLVSALTDAVAVERLLVPGQPLPDDPALQPWVEPKVIADL